MVYQDNKSAILLETNGRMSQSKRTKHIKMKYFFVKDRVDDGDVVIEHLPGDDHWADVLSKPSTGKRFFVDRSKLQNIAVHWKDESLQSTSDMTTMTTATPQECVGRQDSASKTKSVTWKPKLTDVRHRLTLGEAMALSRRIKRARRATNANRCVPVAE